MKRLHGSFNVEGSFTQRERAERITEFSAELPAVSGSFVRSSIDQWRREKSERSFVDDDGRLREEAFNDSAPEREIAADRATVRRLEDTFKESPEINREEAELLEEVKTVEIARWSNGRFIVARTTTYDDFTNGVDQVIVDTETGHIAATIDTTTNLETKLFGMGGREQKGRRNEKVWKRIREGASLKYGIEMEGERSDRHVRLSVDKERRVPILIAVLDREQLLGAANEIVQAGRTIEDPNDRYTELLDERGQASLAAEKTLRGLFVRQIDQFVEDSQMSNEMRGHYTGIRNVFAEE